MGNLVSSYGQESLFSKVASLKGHKRAWALNLDMPYSKSVLLPQKAAI